MSELFSETGRWIFTTIMTLLVIPIGAWLKNKRDARIKEHKELVVRVGKLENKISTIGQKLDDEVSARQLMDKKLDSIFEIVTEVRINTAVNKAKLENK
ncbi:hypothetical protein VPHG_00162 [Vibrio phage 11895-B1]|uniref:hypothetical protein n=1 Tax=Vibrio phage 11895-B1 TaxID=754075 RepID=UPI0002C08B86|nr:hypothetical protein VPHG_00162 [Vibrio phage 11895-B1]AGH32225.1 hypothetical protein VPHG_00162 [Vibrio phage 11895-B1]